MRLAAISISLVGLGSLVGYTLAVHFGPHAAPDHRENTATQETQVARSAGPGQELGTRVISVESELSALRARLEQLEAAPAPSSSPSRKRSRRPPPLRSWLARRKSGGRTSPRSKANTSWRGGTQRGRMRRRR